MVSIKMQPRSCFAKIIQTAAAGTLTALGGSGTLPAKALPSQPPRNALGGLRGASIFTSQALLGFLEFTDYLFGGRKYIGGVKASRAV